MPPSSRRTPPEAPSTVTGRDANGGDVQVEVPCKPERVVVQNLANLDILENPGIWHLAEGGITSLGIMLEDLESALN